MNCIQPIAAVCRLFGIVPDSNPEILSSGHINSTFKVTSGGSDYILQSLNPAVFTSPEAVMSNIAAVQEAFSHGDCTAVTVPEYLPCNGSLFAEYCGKYWRMYRFVSPEETSGDRGRLAGLAFGSFIRTVSGIAVSEAVAGYHDFHGYISRLEALPCDEEPELCGELFRLGETLDRVFSPLPKRIIHGDAKLDNVITGRVCTIIDLDTVMNGYPAIDFGDLIRSLGTNDLSRIEAAVSGFAEGLDGMLSTAEAESLYYGILWTTGELAARYLIDYITDEGYFIGKTREQRLARAGELAGQLSAFRNMENEIKSVIRSIWR